MAVVLGMAWAGGCEGGKSDSGSAAGGMSGAEKEAGDAVMTEVGKHWVKAGDGWVAAFNSGNQFAPNFVRQMRKIEVVAAEPRNLEESDKLNGVQWAGHVILGKTPAREAGETGPVMSDWGGSVMRGKGRWSQWVDVTPENVAAQKVNGRWQVGDQTMLLQGTQPTPADYQMAGVRP